LLLYAATFVSPHAWFGFLTIVTPNSIWRTPKAWGLGIHAKPPVHVNLGGWMSIDRFCKKVIDSKSPNENCQSDTLASSFDVTERATKSHR
jgi:hypothetical protein